VEALGFVSKIQRPAKAERIIGKGLDSTDGIIIRSNKPSKMKPLNPHSFVTLPPDNPGISARASGSAQIRALEASLRKLG